MRAERHQLRRPSPSPSRRPGRRTSSWRAPAKLPGAEFGYDAQASPPSWNLKWRVPMTSASPAVHRSSRALNGDTRRLKATSSRLITERAIRSIGPRHDDAAQLAEYTRRTAEHVHQGALEHAHRPGAFRPFCLQCFFHSPQWVALSSGAQVLPASVLARTACVFVCGLKVMA
jgi:hypothetical protein